MTPYEKLQGVYFLISGAVAYGLWVFARSRCGEPRRKATLFSAWTMLAIISFVLAFLSRDEDGKGFASAFRGVALAFWGGAFWIPMFALAAAVRRTGETRNRDFLLAAIAVAALAVGIDAAFFEPNRLQERRETISFEKWPASAPPFRLAHISDLQTTGPTARNERAAAMVNAWKPDLIVVTGDYMAGPFKDVGPAVAEARKFLGSLRARLGVLCVEGHSETFHEWPLIFTKDLGVELLHNEWREFDLSDGRKLRVYGGAIHDLNLLPLGREASPQTVNVFATHIPDWTFQIPRGTVDLHLAGHTHGGQVVVPFFGAPVTLSNVPREMARGLFRVDDHYINVCAGIGMEGNHAPPVRFLCPPEVCLIEIRGE